MNEAQKLKKQLHDLDPTDNIYSQISALDTEYDVLKNKPDSLDLDNIDALKRAFKRENPTLFHKIRKAIHKKDAPFLLKQLGKGAFWTAAVISNPTLIGGGLLLKKLIDTKKRRDALKKFLADQGVEDEN